MNTSSLDLTKSASVISRKVNQHLARVQRETQAELKRRAEAVDRHNRKLAQEKAIVGRLLAQRIQLAKKGLQRLLAVGQRKPIQQVCRVLDRLRSPFLFFKVSRPSGAAWEGDELGRGTRDVWILFTPLWLEILSGSGQAGLMTRWEIHYKSDVPDQTVARTDEDRRQGFESVEAFLEEMATPYQCDLAVIKDEKQRVYEWAPDDVVFEVLVRCARRRDFEDLLSHSLQQIHVP